MVLAMFKDEYTLRLQQLLLDDEVWNLRQFLQRIGRICKDEVKLLVTRLQESEHITTYRYTRLAVQFLQTLLDEVMVVTIHFHADHLTTTP